MVLFEKKFPTSSHSSWRLYTGTYVHLLCCVGLAGQVRVLEIRMHNLLTLGAHAHTCVCFRIPSVYYALDFTRA